MNCWLRHGSDALANALGYIHHDGGTQISIVESLAMKIAGRQMSRFEAAREQVKRIAAVAMYDDAANTRIFMAGIQVEAVVVTEKPMTAEVVGKIVHSKLGQFLPLLGDLPKQINDAAKGFVKIADAVTGKLDERLHQIQKFWPDNPAVQRARANILRKSVPEPFMEWVMEQQYTTGQWPTGDEALAKATDRAWHGKRGGLSFQSVSRWINIVRTERRKAGVDIGEGEDAMRHKVRQTAVESIKDESPTPDEAAAAAIDRPDGDP